jgi:RNA polymerase sigma factor (sigma-70 family)
MEISRPASNHLADPWKNFKNGDFASLGILFEKYYQELYSYGQKITAGSELVKDVIQDLFIGVWERRDKMAGVENIKAYLIISLRRELIRRVSKDRQENSKERLISNQFSFSPEDFLISAEQNTEQTRVLSKSMESLTERQREVILLRFFHGLEFSDISQALDLNIQSVRNLLFRALDKIRKDLSTQGVTGLDDVEMFLWFIFSKKNKKIILPG